MNHPRRVPVLCGGDEFHPEHFRAEFPRLIVDTNDADPEWTSTILAALRDFDFENDAHCEPNVQKYYKLIRMHGPYEVYAAVHALAMSSPEWALRELYLWCHLGDFLFSQLSDAGLRRFLPFNNLSIMPAVDQFGRGIFVLRFHSMREIRIYGRTFYQPEHSPVITVRGRSFQLVLNGHTIDSIHERLYPTWTTYGTSGDAFTFYARRRYFEISTIRDNYNPRKRRDAVVLYDRTWWENERLHRIIPSTIFASMIAGSQMTPDDCVKQGYCPIDLKGEYATTRTFLAVGFAATDEYESITNAPLANDKRESLIQAAESRAANEYLKSIAQGRRKESVEGINSPRIPQRAEALRYRQDSIGDVVKTINDPIYYEWWE
ncbi:hypothetical protein [Rubinisphaera margarita]|uniref:hypothetical protein n=1 Tax=Rubinisphaera margarita TaxID=2909586 RepID=UPI001EE8697E|nr:hypothetical protein [Rubinisphaera margarita]MCG6158318.1 hypothetical protein [Rubinisphaera margarita]